MRTQLFELDSLARQFVAETWLHSRSTILDQWVESEPFGKMFGILLSTDDKKIDVESFSAPEAMKSLQRAISIGLVRVLQAYSGQLDGVWTRPLWAPSLINHHLICGESWRVQRALHRLTYDYHLAQKRGEESEAKSLKLRRAALSREHARTIRDSTQITSMSGERLPLSKVWSTAPTGVGECCAPKLISHASEMGLRPLGIAEFWWGPSPRKSRVDMIEERVWSKDGHSDSSRMLRFYAPCKHRCQPLLPFMIEGDRS